MCLCVCYFGVAPVHLGFTGMQVDNPSRSGDSTSLSFKLHDHTDSTAIALQHPSASELPLVRGRGETTPQASCETCTTVSDFDTSQNPGPLLARGESEIPQTSSRGCHLPPDWFGWARFGGVPGLPICPQEAEVQIPKSPRKGYLICIYRSVR